MPPVKKGAVYLYRHIRRSSSEFLEWGTLEAVSSIDAYAPVTRSTRKVDVSLLDEAGFLPYGLSPRDLEPGL